MINIISDIIVDNLNLDDTRWLMEELRLNSDSFVKSLENILKMEIKTQEEKLIGQGLCPKCEHELTNIYNEEVHEIWGFRRLCCIPCNSVCMNCGWDDSYL